MFRPLELFVGLRYVRAKRSNHFISFISLVSMLGIGVGVAALIVVLSVMNGFGNELRSRLLSLSSHASLSAANGPLGDWSRVRDTALADPRVLGAAPFVEGEGMLVNGLNLSAVLVSGILPAEEPTVSEIAATMTRGSLERLEAGESNIVLGALLARIVGVGVGDRVNLMVPRPNGGTGFIPQLRRFTVTGLFEVGIQEHDGIRALIHLDDAASLFGLGDGVSGVRLKLADLFTAPLVADELAAELGPGFAATDWTREQATYFRAVKIEKLMMFVILLLIVAVAAFNIVATLFMVVTDKRTDIAIMRTMGMRPGSVMTVFVFQGVIIGLIGTVLGVMLGVTLALNVETLVPTIEAALGTKLIPDDVYYITEVPSDMRRGEVLAIWLSAFALCVLSTLYPAWRAARTPPAEALRYE